MLLIPKFQWIALLHCHFELQSTVFLQDLLDPFAHNLDKWFWRNLFGPSAIFYYEESEHLSRCDRPIENNNLHE
jgi:hypothetical protein